jgi:hypothetical protein
MQDKAHDVLMHADARGGTERTTGLLEAAKLLDGGAGDILALTDGQVVGTERFWRPRGLPASECIAWALRALAKTGSWRCCTGELRC